MSATDLSNLLCKERIWNQGKASRMSLSSTPNCAKSGFGIKAKLAQGAPVIDEDCAKSGFGIKAKPAHAAGDVLPY